jgi:chaperone required for assembly of F1-ATPase
VTDETAPLRFYKAATAAPAEGGFAVLLDGRRLRTPMKAHFVAPTLALAEGCAAEWNGQGKQIIAATMPLTRLLNVALDHAPRARDELAAEIGRYAETDLVCHRAERPPALVARQAEAWDPLLTWAHAIGAPLKAGAGVFAHGQPQSSLEMLTARAAEHDDFRLTGLAHGAALAGSALIAFAIAEGRLNADAAFAAGALDDLWQLETWGEDDEARQRLNNQAAEYAALEQFFAALNPV